MDGLALLCNLFADGPVTLKRLRGARVTSLGELERANPEHLAPALHASVPQARAFVEEARRLTRRLAETSVPAPPRSPRRALQPVRAFAGQGSAPLVPNRNAQALPLRPGLFPGLDERVHARLHLQHVRTVQALSESAGLALARRTGIPYATLLELARSARRFLAEAGRTSGSGPRLAEVELVPFVSRPKRAPAENELARSDEFTLPLVEPESAGPFG